MPSGERPTYTPPKATSSERDRRANAVVESLGRLEQAVAAIQDSETFRRYLDAQARFHTYSWGNVLLILGQRPHATQVAGFRTWQRMNRYVRRGEKGIRILVPMTRRVSRESSGEAEDDGEDDPRRLFFGVGHVFDISQTEGEPLPRVEVPILEGEEGAELYARLRGIAASEGVGVEQVDQLPRERMGYYEPVTRRIVVRAAPRRQMTKTLAHELAHHFGGATESSPEEETIAESVAYVVCARFGLDTGERSFPYVATWAREPKVLKGAMLKIQGISSQIIGRIEPQETKAPIGSAVM